MIYLLLVLATIALVALGFLVSGRTPELYSNRGCMGAVWRKSFPNSSKEEIRQFLWFFASAFAVPRRQALQLAPNDELLTIYRTRYLRNDLIDALEFEVLAKNLYKKHRFSLHAIWHDRLTVGELFARLSEAKLKGLTE
jgi:propanediol dehydratase small subunit